MAKVQNIMNFWRANGEENSANGLVADFNQLVDMRRYVPFLKETKFAQSSMQAGDARSVFKGRGVEFEEVRAYSFGDNVRDIDWRVTARKNQPFTKLYAEEKDREVYVWLDLSSYMAFGTRQELKSVTAAKVAALLGWFAIENKDRFGTAIYDGFRTQIFESRRTQENLLFILKHIQMATTKLISDTNTQGQIAHERETVAQSWHKLQHKIGKRAIVFALSSFDQFTENFAKPLSSLSRYYEAFIVNVYDALEDIAPPKGEYLAQYGNEKVVLSIPDGDFSTIYHNFFAQKRQIIKDFCAKFNCRYRQVRTDLPVYEQLRPI